MAKKPKAPAAGKEAGSSEAKAAEKKAPRPKGPTLEEKIEALSRTLVDSGEGSLLAVIT